MNFDTITIFAGITFFIAIIPGPNALLVLYTSLTLGKQNAFANILGVATGFIVHALVSAAGLSLVLSQSAFAFELLKWLGVLYLAYLGVTNLRASFSISQVTLPSDALTHEKYLTSFIKGILTNLLNPKIVLFYLSIFPQFVSTEQVFTDSVVLGATQALIVTAWFSFVIFTARQLKIFLSQASTRRGLNFISGTIFLGFSAKLASFKL